MTPPSPSISRRGLFRLAAGAGGLALLAGLTGCTPPSVPPIGSGEIDLSFWTHDDAYVRFFTDAVPRAEAASAFRYALGVTKAGAADIVTKLIAQAVAGTGTPDVVGLEIGAFTRTLRGTIASELLTDLTDIVAPFGDDLMSARTAPFSKDGRLYALDSDTPMTVYYHRGDEFERLGLPDTFGTWDDFLATGAKLADSDGISLGAIATSDPGGTVQTFHVHLLQRGGGLFDAAGEPTLETPEAEDTLRMLVTGVQSGALATVSDMYGPGMQSGLKSGKIIGVNMPSWYSTYGIQPSAPEQEGLWRISPLPRFAGGGGRTGAGGGTGFAVLRDKPASEAGVQLITAAYLDPEQQIKRYRDMGYLPTLRSVYDSPELAALEDGFFGGQRLFEVYRDIVDEAPEIHQSENQSIMDTVLSGHLLRAYRGQATPAEALTDAARDFRGQARG